MARYPELEGTSVVVTGAARGIGEAIARRFVAEGANVVACDKDAGAIRALEESFGDLSTGRFIGVECDVTQASSVNNLIKYAADQYGGLDVLVNNAGVAVPEPLMEATLDAWRVQMDVNALGVFLCTQAGARLMREQGRGGRIINNASGAGRTSPGEVPLGVYAASKHAAVGLTRAFADELAGDNILVNCVCAGVVDTGMWALIDAVMTARSGEAPGTAMSRILSSVPLGRVQDPSDVAAAVVFLASDDAGYITGQAFSVDGGLLKI